jgi:YD repeat-containing protein
MALLPGCRAARVFVTLLLVLMGLSPPSLAQQITYEYDALGRLAVVTTPEGVAQYEYDAVGNILRITTRRFADSTGPVAILGMTPAKGVPGTRVFIYGKGFATNPGDNRVTFNGTDAAVTASTINTITVTVPAGATTGPISLAAPQGSAISPEPFIVLQAFAVAPDQAEVALSGLLDFRATLSGVSNADVTWRVSGLVGGNASLGTISAEGTYTAPTSPPSVQPVLVEAVLIADPTQVAAATVRVVGQAPAWVTAASVTVGPAGARGALAVAQPVTVGPTTTLAISGPVTVTGGPVVMAIVPSTGHPGNTITVTVLGANLQGASEIRFLQATFVDSTFTVSGLIPSTDGKTATCNVTISPTAPLGVRVLQVITSQGRSSVFDHGTNRFTIAMP